MAILIKLLIVAATSLSWSRSAPTEDQTEWYPTYHVAPTTGWMNDPNGLIYHNGYYHVFWQYNPDSPVWGLMHWGHARSTDLLNWEHLPIALTPSLPEDIDGIFSGSAVVKDDKLTLIYTGISESSTRQRQMAAVSTSSDDLEFEKLGVIIDKEGDELNFRDPKAWWQDDSWFVVIGSKIIGETGDRGEVLLYSSKDFVNWIYEGPLAQSDDKLGYMWECPDFFTLEGKQILVISPQGIASEGYDYQNLYQTGYFVGNWAPGNNYTIEKEFKEFDHGHDFYASQTFLAPDGRRIQIGWLDMWESEFPENVYGWSCMLTIPRELTLSETGAILVRPVREIEKARSSRRLQFNKLGMLEGRQITFDGILSNEVRMDFDLSNSAADTFGIELKAGNFSNLSEGLTIYLDRGNSRLVLERYYPQYNIESSTRSLAVDLSRDILSLDIFFDSSSVEVFVNDGEAVMSSRIYPNNDQRTLYTYGNGQFEISNIAIWDL